MNKEGEENVWTEEESGSPSMSNEIWVASFRSTFDEFNGGVSSDNHLPH